MIQLQQLKATITTPDGVVFVTLWYHDNGLGIVLDGSLGTNFYCADFIAFDDAPELKDICSGDGWNDRAVTHLLDDYPVWDWDLFGEAVGL